MTNLVRISHLAWSEDPHVQIALATMARSLLDGHMRRGSLSPRASRICEGGPAEAIQACRVIEGASLMECSGNVSNHF